MAIDPKDVYLDRGLTAPSDVRLGGVFVGTTTITSSISAATESYASGTLVESFLALFGASTETYASAVAVETFVASIASRTETYAGLALVEAFSAAITAATETYSAAVLVETFATAVQAVTETYVALAAEQVTEIASAVTASTETGASAVADVINPTVPRGFSAAGGGMGGKHRKRFIYPEPEPAFAEAAFTPSKPWTPEKDAESEDDLMSVFAMMIDEDLV